MCRKRNWRAKKTGSFRAGTKETPGKTHQDTKNVRRKIIYQRTFYRSRDVNRRCSAGVLAWTRGRLSWSSHGQFWQLSQGSENAKKIDSIKLSYYSIILYMHICTQYFVNKFSTLRLGSTYTVILQKVFPPRAKTSFCLSNQKLCVNILEPRHLIVNWAHFFSNVCSFYLFSDIIMELFILQFISSWLFENRIVIDSC